MHPTHCAAQHIWRANAQQWGRTRYICVSAQFEQLLGDLNDCRWWRIMRASKDEAKCSVASAI
jgi:hypothetical protein